MVKVVVDSSIVIEKIRRGSEVFDNLIKLQKSRKVNLCISVVAIAELWAGESMNVKKEESIVEHLVSVMERIEVNEEIAKLSGEIVRKYKIGSMDALIAALALESEADLATLNAKHFVGIKGIKLYKIQSL